MGKVVITADENGNVIRVSENPDIGYITLTQETDDVTDKGWLRISKRSALLLGKMEDLQKMNYKAGQQLEGKIVIKESLIPFDTKNPDRNLKIAGATGIPCRVDDEPIYRQTFYSLDVEAADELIQHTNTEEIKEVLSIQRANSSQALKDLANKARGFALNM